MDLSNTKEVVQIVVCGIDIVGAPVGIWKYVLNRGK